MCKVSIQGGQRENYLTENSAIRWLAAEGKMRMHGKYCRRLGES